MGMLVLCMFMCTHACICVCVFGLCLRNTARKRGERKKQRKKRSLCMPTDVLQTVFSFLLNVDMLQHSQC